MKNFLLRIGYYILYRRWLKVPQIQAFAAIAGVILYKTRAETYNIVTARTNIVSAEGNMTRKGQKPITKGWWEAAIRKGVKTYNANLAAPFGVKGYKK